MKKRKTTASNPETAFSHLDSQGSAQMVNVGQKIAQQRRAIDEGRLVCRPETIVALREKALPKGDVLTVAKYCRDPRGKKNRGPDSSLPFALAQSH